MQLNTQYQALPQMNEQSTKRDKTLEKIAAGLQLRMDDSAVRSIASQMQNDIGSFSQEYMNTNDSISMMQIADGALSNLSDQSQKLNELSVRSNSAILNSADRQVLQNEFQRTQTSMQDIVNTTSFNEKSLLDSSLSPKNLSPDNQEGIASYMQTLSSAQSDVGAAVNNYISHANTLLEQITQTSAAKSQIADTDMAKAISDFQSSNQLLDASVLASAHQTQFLRESIGRLLG
ncbi:MAG: flagellin [Sulfuricurvum sp.]|jgi:flagellin